MKGGAVKITKLASEACLIAVTGVIGEIEPQNFRLGPKLTKNSLKPEEAGEDFRSEPQLLPEQWAEPSMALAGLLHYILHIDYRWQSMQRVSNCRMDLTPTTHMIRRYDDMPRMQKAGLDQSESSKRRTPDIHMHRKSPSNHSGILPR